MSDTSAIPFDASHPPAIAGFFDDLLDQATARLAGDRELQREVRQELRAHLEDGLAERIAAGIAPAAAEQDVRAALGDVAELSNQLFKTHERRLRVRRVIKWTCATAFIPAALTLLFFVGRSAIISMAMGLQIFPAWSGERETSVESVKKLSNLAFDEQLAGLSADDQLLVRAVFSGEFERRIWDRVEPAKRLSDRWPNNAVYHGYYVNEYFGTATEWYHHSSPWKFDPATANSLLADIDRGATLDPDNGFYNMLRANVMFRQSCRPIQTTDGPNNLAIDDSATFQQGLAEWRKSWTTPRFTDYTNEITTEARAKLPHPENLSAMLLQLQPYETPQAAMSCVYICAGFVFTEASRDPKTANAEELLRWLDGMLAVTGRMTAGNVMYADHYSETIKAWRYDVLETLGRTEEAKAAEKASRIHGRRMQAYWKGPRGDILAHSALKSAAEVATPQRYEFERAEYAVVDRAALCYVIAILAIIAVIQILLTGAGSLVDRFRSPRHSVKPRPPRFVFIGWRRLAWICCIALLMPLALYAIWTRFSAMGHRYENPWTNWVRLIIEYFILATVMLTLLWRMTLVAVRQRGQELGLIDAPKPNRWRNVALAFVAIAFNLAATSFVLSNFGLSLDGPGSNKNHLNTAFWIWLPCLTPICWIAVGMAWRFAAQRQRGRMFLTSAITASVIIELVIGLFIYDPTVHGVKLSAHEIVLPAYAWLLVGLASVAGPMLLIMLLSPAGETLEFAPFNRLLVPSAMPVIGASILLLALICGWPLGHAERSAIRDIQTAAAAPSLQPASHLSHPATDG